MAMNHLKQEHDRESSEQRMTERNTSTGIYRCTGGTCLNSDQTTTEQGTSQQLCHGAFIKKVEDRIAAPHS